MTDTGLTRRQQQILEFIDLQIRDRGYPPSVREIGQAVGLTSPSTVHSHLATLQDRGFIRRDPSKPRALEVCLDPSTGAAVERGTVRHVPLVGDVAAGTDVLAHQNIEESLPLPSEFTGEGELFMLRVRGDSMVNAGILDGDHVVVRVQQTANCGDLVVAGFNDEEGTVKIFDRDGDEVLLRPANDTHSPIRRPAAEISIYGAVVTVLRRV
ncbi:MAG TPA: transcriptional repressor LexA [Acidimicrobiaceae bacterium]|nr:LexA repressor [Acidimicrobiaceae bacterium]HCV34620.1 transcriptional repressor LexA [Acidimicrobiaceae bacterium]|tara:strand:+ start:550 stop:1182 length:633 start_codon:yes stop_codon:yes gene_type:complete